MCQHDTQTVIKEKFDLHTCMTYSEQMEIHTNNTGAIYDSAGKPMKAEFFHRTYKPDEYQRDVYVT